MAKRRSAVVVEAARDNAEGRKRLVNAFTGRYTSEAGPEKRLFVTSLLAGREAFGFRGRFIVNCGRRVWRS